ncbi:MAG: hypothetical protein ABFR31_03185 [Thermodesulfobacteriota bacterium]
MDISGQWDAQLENYGPWSQYGSYPAVIKIILDGNSFVGILMKPTKFHSAGKESFRGKLDKHGINKLQIMTGIGPIDAKGQISENGNKIITDDGEKVRGTFIRASKNICFDLNGKWDAVYDTGGWGVYEDAMWITHKDNQFVGIYLYKGDNQLGKKQEKIKGKTSGNGFEKVLFHVVDPAAFELFWDPSEGTISEDGNGIFIKRAYDYKRAKITQTLKLKRR